MRVRFFLPVLAIALFLSACSNQAGPATPSTIAATDTPVSTSPSYARPTLHRHTRSNRHRYAHAPAAAGPGLAGPDPDQFPG